MVVVERDALDATALDEAGVPVQVRVADRLFGVLDVGRSLQAHRPGVFQDRHHSVVAPEFFPAWAVGVRVEEGDRREFAFLPVEVAVEFVVLFPVAGVGVRCRVCGEIRVVELLGFELEHREPRRDHRGGAVEPDRDDVVREELVSAREERCGGGGLAGALVADEGDCLAVDLDDAAVEDEEAALPEEFAEADADE